MRRRRRGQLAIHELNSLREREVTPFSRSTSSYLLSFTAAFLFCFLVRKNCKLNHPKHSAFGNTIGRYLKYTFSGFFYVILCSLKCLSISKLICNGFRKTYSVLKHVLVGVTKLSFLLGSGHFYSERKGGIGVSRIEL